MMLMRIACTVAIHHTFDKRNITAGNLLMGPLVSYRYSETV